MPFSNLSRNHLAVTGVLFLIFFLAFTSQLLFPHIDPGPLSRRQTLIFNGLVAYLLTCYARTCLTPPGVAPRGWAPEGLEDAGTVEDGATQQIKSRTRWCRKCEAYKPPRAHHCKVCQGCVLKMDHHCPWTANCVSHVTFPHFFRFISYAVAAMSYLEYFLCIRASIIWRNRNYPSYLGPTPPQLIHLFTLLLLNTLTLLSLLILHLRTTQSLLTNTTFIESWEIDRHATLLRRARAYGGYLPGPDGARVRIQRQEFPYDVGFWRNVGQGMGSVWPWVWAWPFARSLRVESGLCFETNGFEDESVTWPPPDPDRMPRVMRRFDMKEAFVYQEKRSGEEEMRAFRERQEADFERRRVGEGEPPWEGEVRKRKVFHRRPEVLRKANMYRDEDEDEDQDDESERSGDGYGSGEGEEGEEAWKNSEGERLADFGVDEDVEFYDEEDIPLAELIRRRREAQGL